MIENKRNTDNTTTPAVYIRQIINQYKKGTYYSDHKGLGLGDKLEKLSEYINGLKQSE